MTSTLNTGIVAILTQKQHIEGTGFLVSKDLVVTCAHVIQSAGKAPGQEIQIQFRSSKQTMTALVEPNYWKPPDQEDIAFLRLLQDKPEQEEILLLGSSSGTSGHPFETLGFPASLDEARGYGTIGGPVTLANRKLLQLTGTTEITAGFSGAPVLNKQTRRVIGMVASIATPDKYGKLTETAFIIPSEILRAACEDIQLSDIRPYQSLATFTEQNAEFFFGREEITQRILDKLRGKPRFLAILGPSGSGKSSLIKAGVIPQLHEGKILGSEKWTFLVTRPADKWVDSIRYQDGKLFGEGLSGYQDWLESLNQDKHLLLVIDQFEELLIADEETIVQEYLDLITHFLEAGRNLTLIVVLRDDFYGRLSQMAPELLPWLERGLINIPQTLSQNELRDIIEKPGKSVGLAFETGLVDTLIRDAMEAMPDNQETRRMGRSTTLPLLEFTLTQLWEKRTDGVLTFQAYQTIGGVTGGLAQWAQDTFDALNESQQAIAKSILTSLVHLGDENQSLPDTRWRKPLQDLYRDFDGHQIDAILERLTKARLLISFRDERQNKEYVEIVHEALIREWESLRNWLRDDQSFLLWRQEIESRTRTWVNSNPDDIESRDEGKLLRGKDLAIAEDTLSKHSQELEQYIHDFILAGVHLRDKETAEREATRQRELEQAKLLAEEQRRSAEADRKTSKKVRLFAIGITGILLIAVLALIFALIQLSVAQARHLALKAENAYKVKNYQVATLLALESKKLDPTNEMERLLAQLPYFEDPFSQTLAEDAGKASSVAWSSDGRHIAVGECVDGGPIFCSQVAVIIWDIVAGDIVQTLLGHNQKVVRIAWSPDGNFLTSGSYDGTIMVWDAEKGTQLETLVGQTNLEDLAWSSDGGRLASGGCAEYKADDYACKLGKIVVWDTKTGEQFQMLEGHKDSVLSVVWSPDNQYLASGARDGTIIIWGGATGDKLLDLDGYTGVVRNIVWSSDGNRLTSTGCQEQNGSCEEWEIIVWDVNTGTQLQILANFEGDITELEWSLDSSRLAIAGCQKWDIVNCVKGGIAVLDFANGTKFPTLTGHSSAIIDVAWSPDGNRLVSVSPYDIPIVWHINTGRNLQKLVGHSGEISSMTWSPNGKLLASVSLDDTIILWDTAIGTELQTISEHSSEIYNLLWSPDGNLVASAGCQELDEENDCTRGEIIIWDAISGRWVETLTGHSGRVWSAAWSPDSSRLVSAGCQERNEDNSAMYTCIEGEIIIWNLVTATNIQTINLNSNEYVNVTWLPDGNRLASISADDKLSLWDATTGTLLQTLSGYTGNVQSKAQSWSPDGNRLASAICEEFMAIITEPCPRGEIVLWDIRTGMRFQIFTGHSEDVRGTAWSPDGSRLASAYCFGGSFGPCIRGDIILWDAMTGKQLQSLNGPTSGVTSIAWSSSGSLASSTSDGIIYIIPEQFTHPACEWVGRNMTEEEWLEYRGPMFVYRPACPNLGVPDIQNPLITLRGRVLILVAFIAAVSALGMTGRIGYKLLIRFLSWLGKRR